MLRTLEGKNPFGRVTNGHSTPITIVVSKDKPKRIMTGRSIKVGPEGAGGELKSERYSQPATCKIAQLNQEAAFPLWTRSNGYGVITIYTGVGEYRKLYIENDRISAGVRATFVNEPDLVVEDL